MNMSLTPKKREFLKLLTPTLKKLFSENVNRRDDDDIEKFIYKQILIDNKTFSVSKYNFCIDKLSDMFVIQMYTYLESIGIPLSTLHHEARLNPILLDRYELELHTLMSEHEIETINDIVLF